MSKCRQLAGIAERRSNSAKKPTSRLSKLLSSPPDSSWTGGRKCEICAHKQQKQIDADVREFDARENKYIPWTVFFAYVRTEYGVRTCDTSMRRHAIRCLGLERAR